jgi:hypothetical protein
MSFSSKIDTSPRNKSRVPQSMCTFGIMQARPDSTLLWRRNKDLWLHHLPSAGIRAVCISIKTLTRAMHCIIIVSRTWQATNIDIWTTLSHHLSRKVQKATDLASHVPNQSCLTLNNSATPDRIHQALSRRRRLRPNNRCCTNKYGFLTAQHTERAIPQYSLVQIPDNRRGRGPRLFCEMSSGGERCNTIRVVCKILQPSYARVLA